MDLLEIFIDDLEVLLDCMMFNYLKYMYKFNDFFFCSIYYEKKKLIIEFN